MEPIIFLGKEIYINPIALEFGPLKIYWYGIIIVFGMTLAFYLLIRRMNEKKKNVLSKNNLKNEKFVTENQSGVITFDTVIDYLIGAIIIGFASARLYYVLFNLDYYLKDPLKIFMIWNGGIAIYGGVIGAILYGVHFCKKRSTSFK